MLKMRLDLSYEYEGEPTFLNHHVIIQNCDEQHEVPQQHQQSHQAEEEPHYWCVLRILSPEGEELLIFKFRQRRIRSAGIVRHSLVLLISDVVLDPLPAQVRLAFLVHHQVAEDEEEAVAG